MKEKVRMQVCIFPNRNNTLSRNIQPYNAKIMSKDFSPINNLTINVTLIKSARHMLGQKTYAHDHAEWRSNRSLLQGLGIWHSKGKVYWEYLTP